MSNTVIALGAVIDGKQVIVVNVSDDLVARGVHAGDLARKAGQRMGGGGGGSATWGQAGSRLRSERKELPCE